MCNLLPFLKEWVHLNSPFHVCKKQFSCALHCWCQATCPESYMSRRNTSFVFFTAKARQFAQSFTRTKTYKPRRVYSLCTGMGRRIYISLRFLNEVQLQKLLLSPVKNGDGSCGAAQHCGCRKMPVGPAFIEFRALRVQVMGLCPCSMPLSLDIHIVREEEE